MGNVLERIRAVQGDITRLPVEAIVNAANRSLLGGGGVDGAIHRAAGPELLVECRSLGGCPTGEARLTRGYRLPARWVIHTVGPVYSGAPRDAALLAACYRNALAIAARKHMASVAFPAISCGAYGYPLVDACRIAVDTVRGFLEQHAEPREVWFVLFGAAELAVYQERLEAVGRATA
jgi:O-acetyl-ADP-ribose deacetylase (regulator of RNase III)